MRAPAVLLAAVAAVGWWPGGDSDTLLLIHPQWCDVSPDDPYNRLPAPPALVDARRDFVPGEVLEVSADGHGWRVGKTIYNGSEINVWDVADERRGDLARRYMYLATRYSRPLWRGNGAMLLEDGGHPYLRPYGISLLMNWHRGDSVDERERAEMAALMAQGAPVNPFVDDPSLAEYYWGIHAGEPMPGDSLPGEPSHTPLKGIYSISADSLLWLECACVPADAVWSIDGRDVTSPVSLETLATGHHEARYTSPAGWGGIIIHVTP